MRGDVCLTVRRRVERQGGDVSTGRAGPERQVDKPPLVLGEVAGAVPRAHEGRGQGAATARDAEEV
eukprot:751673-Hanusia_phi.AAC.2